MSVVLSVVVYGTLCFSAVALLLYIVGVFNQLIFLARECDRSFANTDVLLKQRHDEIPSLVEICRGYANFESSLLDEVTALRAHYRSASEDGEKVSAENDFNHALAQITALLEDYPDLKASEHFQRLSGRLTELETSIADRRELYNSCATSYNEFSQQFPQLLIARVLGCRDRSLLEASDAERQLGRASFAAPVTG